jgi:NurA-like 5'-3' nuclease
LQLQKSIEELTNNNNLLTSNLQQEEEKARKLFEKLELIRQKELEEDTSKLPLLLNIYWKLASKTDNQSLLQQISMQNAIIEALQNEKKLIMVEMQKRMDKVFESSPPVVAPAKTEETQQPPASLTSSLMSYFYSADQ